jgi:hypothetical protein
MNNITTDISITKNFFRQYFFGDSLKHIFIRLTFILLIIIIIWLFMMFIIMIYIKYQKRKQIQNIVFDNLTCKISPKIKQKYLFWSRRYEDNNLSSNSNSFSNEDIHFTETYSNIQMVKIYFNYKKNK